MAASNGHIDVVKYLISECNVPIEPIAQVHADIVSLNNMSYNLSFSIILFFSTMNDATVLIMQLMYCNYSVTFYIGWNKANSFGLCER